MKFIFYYIFPIFGVTHHLITIWLKKNDAKKKLATYELWQVFLIVQFLFH